MRTFCLYIVVFLIAVQSVNAISAKNDSHDIAHQHSHQNNHHQAAPNNHHSNTHHHKPDLVTAQTIGNQAMFADSEHTDCHAQHCHHNHQSNLVYIDLSEAVHLAKTADKQVAIKNISFNSLLNSPASRPPIV